MDLTLMGGCRSTPRVCTSKEDPVPIGHCVVSQSFWGVRSTGVVLGITALTVFCLASEVETIRVTVVNVVVHHGGCVQLYLADTAILGRVWTALTGISLVLWRCDHPTLASFAHSVSSRP